MKVLIDEMYAGLKPLLVKKYLTVKTVQEVLGSGAKDGAVIKYAKESEMVLVTGDCRIPKKAKGSGIKIVLVSKEDIATVIDLKLMALQMR